MNRIVTDAETIVGALTTDTFHFIYGKGPDQNHGVDGLDFTTQHGVAILDYPLKAQTQKATVTGTKLVVYQMFMLFMYKVDLDATQVDKDILIQKAWNAAEEFSMRLNKLDGLQNIALEKYEDAEYYFDLNMCGCALTISAVFKVSTPNCGI